MNKLIVSQNFFEIFTTLPPEQTKIIIFLFYTNHII